MNRSSLFSGARKKVVVVFTMLSFILLLAAAPAPAEAAIPRSCHWSETFQIAGPVTTTELVSMAPLNVPPDPPSDFAGMEPFFQVLTRANIQTAYNQARAHENQDTVRPAYEPMPMMNLTSSFTQAQWDALTPSQQGLWLLNNERAARGIPQLEGINGDLETVMHSWTDYLLAAGPPYTHGNLFQRINANPNLAGCYQLIGENLAYYSPINDPLLYPVAEAIYDWTYEDSSSAWGHRHNNLADGYFDNTGVVGQEGLIGFALSVGEDDNGFPIIITGVDFYDPKNTCGNLVPGTASAVHADYDDLAVSYGKTWHTGTGPYLGGNKTIETRIISSDLRDDGVVLPANSNWNDGQGEVLVSVNALAGQWTCLNAWLDYSDGSTVAGEMETPNGVFDNNERVIRNRALQKVTNASVSWAMPVGVMNPDAVYNMRFRLVADPNNDGNCSDVTGPLGAARKGAAGNGEVEGYTFASAPMGVTLAEFAAEQNAEGAVTLTWQTGAEFGDLSYTLYRSDVAETPGEMLDGSLLSAHSQDAESPGFTWIDTGQLVNGQMYWYWLAISNEAGVTTLHGPVSVTYAVPTAVTLTQLHAANANSGWWLWLWLAALPVVWQATRKAAKR